ncbi:tyrosine-type recombinase/integrase [Bacillus pacificus]
MGRKKSDKTIIRELVEQGKKRNYITSKRETDAQLGISDKHGWNEQERDLYKHLKRNMDKALASIDMTRKENRKDDRTKKDFKKSNNQSFGIWSVSYMEKIRQTGKNFIKHVVKSYSEERKKNPNAKKLEQFKHIRETHIRKYIEDKRSGSWRSNFVKNEEDWKGSRESSISAYISRLEKVFEGMANIGLKSHDGLVERSGVKEEIGTISVYDRVRGRGETDGKKGYTLDQCRRLIDSVDDNPVGKAMLQVLTYVGLRYDTLRQVTWDEFLDLETKQIKRDLNFADGSKFKGGRVLSTELNEETRESLQVLYDSGAFKETDQVFGYMSRYKMEKVIRTACDRTGIDYKAFHEFRYGTKEYFEEKAKEMDKEQLVREILGRVNSIYTYGEDGEKEFPLNRIEKQFKYAKDEEGNKIIERTLKDGTKKYKKDYDIDRNGQVRKDYRYTFDKLISRRVDFLESVYISLSLSHNRPDITSVYEDKDALNEIVEEKENVEEAIERTAEFLDAQEEQEELPRDQWKQLSLFDEEE